MTKALNLGESEIDSSLGRHSMRPCFNIALEENGLNYVSRTVALVALLGGLSSAAGAEPLVLASVVDGHFMVADMATLNKQAAFRKIWVYVKFSRPTLQNGKRLVLAKMLHEFDCKNQEMRPTFLKWEDENGVKGSAPLHDSFTPVVPGEASMTLYRLVCGEGQTDQDSVFVSMDHLADVQSKWSQLQAKDGQRARELKDQKPQ